MVQIQDYIDPYRLKRFLISVIILASLLVVVLFLTLILHKLYVEFRTKRLKRLRDGYVKAISLRLVEPGCEIKQPEKKMEYEALGDVLIDMVASISGGIERTVKDIARELAIDDFYKKNAVRGRWVNRLIAVEKLGFLKLPEMKGFFRALIVRTNDPEILARAVLALSFIADEEDDLTAVNTILNDPLFRSSKFNEFVYTNIIKSFGEKGIAERFVAALERLMESVGLSIMLKRDIVEACGSEMFYAAKDVILRTYAHFRDVPEMKITCIRALGRLGGDDVCRLIGDSLQDDDWRVRAVSARNAHLCSDEVIGLLRDSLRDENYFVRINSALSLSKLGEKGLAALEDAIHSSDRFTGDVSRYILKEVRVRA